MARSWGSVQTAVAAGILLVPGPGCAEESIATLVPVRCGLEPDAFDALRVETRGDFPPSDGVSLSLGAVHGTIDDLDPAVRAITVEGTFGDSIEAVGRTARLEREGPLPVYFAPPDAWCGLESPIAPRQVGALTVLPNGHVLAVGGRDADGRLLDDVVHSRDVGITAEVSREHLPIPSLGQTVHPWDDDVAIVIGGAGSNPTAFASVIEIDVLSEGELLVHDPVPIEIDGKPEGGRAHHGGVRLSDGTVLVAGGCKLSDEGACVPTADSVLNSTLFVRRGEDGSMTFASGPSMIVPRYGHHLLVARDDVVFAVGGLDHDGRSVIRVEVLRPGETGWGQYGWDDYGPSLYEHVVSGQVVLGAAVLEGGLLVLLFSDGMLLWLDEHNVEELDAWCDAGDTPCALGTQRGAPDPSSLWLRHLVALPGERVLLDSMIVSPALFQRTGSDAIDLAVPPSLHASTPPRARMGGHTALLADGSVVVMGGVTAAGEPAAPFMARVRPALDGPDERVPEIGRLAAGAFVVHGAVDPSATSPYLQLEGNDDEGQLSTWAHIRGFRSRRFRFDVDLLAYMFARPWLVFPSGAIERIEIRFDDDAVRAVYRRASGASDVVVCAAQQVVFAGSGKLLRVDASPSAIVVRTSGSNGEIEVVAECPGLDLREVAVGIGVVGQGTLRASNLRLTRG